MNLDRIIAVRNDKTVYRDGDVCVKVFGSSYSQADILNEALNQVRAEEAGLCVPKVKEITMLDGKWAILFEYIKGDTLSQLMQRNPAQKIKYLELMLKLQCAIHEKRGSKLCRMTDRIVENIEKADFPATVRYDLYERLEAMPKLNKFCHGDFNPTNIIISRDGTPYFLDWSHAVQGDNSADVVKTYLWLHLNGDTAAEKYLELFCEQSGVDMQYVQKWMPLVAAAQLASSNEAERKNLSLWIDVVNHE